jgi:hypothetical protein
MNTEERARAILALSRFTGSSVSGEFIKKTREHFSLAGIPRIHNLLQGIYKPAGDPYVFSIWSRSAMGMDREIYPDSFFPEEDGTWTMYYAPKKGSIDSDVNQGLINCMRDKVPILVIVTDQPAGSPGGARYKLIGPALIESFETSSQRFFVRGASRLVVETILPSPDPLGTAELLLRNNLVLPFRIKEDSVKYSLERAIRNSAFRKIVLDEYNFLCIVCHAKFLLKQEGQEPLIEAEASHIISVEHHGPDDPRNGLSFCRRHHWAFDQGLFTITDGRLIKISPVIQKAERRRFDLEEYEGNRIVSPANVTCLPHEHALHWHQSKVFMVS